MENSKGYVGFFSYSSTEADLNLPRQLIACYRSTYQFIYKTHFIIDIRSVYALNLKSFSM